MKLYRRKNHILQVFMEITEDSFEDARKICDQLRLNYESPHPVEIVRPKGGPLGNGFGCYLVKDEDGDWGLWSPEFMDEIEPLPELCEGGLQWVKGRYDELYRQVRSGKETVCYVDYQTRVQEVVLRDICTVRNRPGSLELSVRGTCYGSSGHPAYTGDDEQRFVQMCTLLCVEWLNESASPSTANTEDEKEKWTPEEIQGLENQIELLEGQVYKLSNQLEASKEQQIAFADWAIRNGWEYHVHSGVYHLKGESKRKETYKTPTELHKLFLTDTKQQ